MLTVRIGDVLVAIRTWISNLAVQEHARLLPRSWLLPLTSFRCRELDVQAGSP
jgi:hypothetical protein